jgi:subtilisin
VRSRSNDVRDQFAVWRINGDATSRRPTGRGVRVAVIDSGAPPFGARARLDEGMAFRRDPDTGDIIESSETRDTIGHGTQCTRQVLSVAPDVRIIPVKVFHDTMETDPVLVERAIAWATQRGANVISMSLATSRDDVIGPWYRACERAAASGATLVAAAGTSPEHSYPAGFDCVLGVRAAATASPFDFRFEATARYECAAWGWTPFVAKKATSRSGINSLAAATMAGVIAVMLDGYAPPDRQSLHALLARFATPTLQPR